MRRRLLTVLTVLTIVAVPAAGTLPGVSEPVDLRVTTNPVATDEATYQAFARVFSDPQGCLRNGAGAAGEETPISPWAKGRACAVDYLSYAEVVEGAHFLARRFPDLVEVIRLDEAYDNDDYVSAGIARAAGFDGQDARVLTRDRSPLYLFKVTNSASAVPEEDRLHFAYSLSIHGLERAGLEGGVRAMEDLVTWAACEQERYADNTPACAVEGPFPKKIVESETELAVPTASEVLEETVSYFFLPNPDGWRNGQKKDPVEVRDGGVNGSYVPGVTFARGNGNGVDLNRDWPNVGYTQRSHQPWSEPETRAYGEVLLDIKDRLTSGHFAGGIDLHGMLDARAFSYTLLGADQRNYHKNQLTVETSLRTYDDQTERLRWSPWIADSDGNGVQDAGEQGVIPVADEWGTIYDTINYTVTGALGFWMDSPLGLGGVGINNEMALSNLAPDTIYEHSLVQTHVDGNKGLIYSQIAALMYEETSTYVPGGDIGYVFNPVRITQDGEDRPPNVGGFPAQEDIDVLLPCQNEVAPNLAGGGCGLGTFSADGATGYYEFEVKSADDFVHNGGMTVTSTRPGTEQGSTVGNVHASVVLERFNCDHGTECEWIVEKDLSRTAVTLNDPVPGDWRVRFSAASGFPRRLAIDFDAITAEESPGQTPIDASSMDFFGELNDWVPEGEELRPVDVEDLLGGPEALDGLDSLVVVHNLGRAEYLTEELGLDAAQVEAYFDALRGFAAGGGNLVLTDAGLFGLEDLGLVPAGSIQQLGGGSGGSNVAGAYQFRTADDLITYEHTADYPLTEGLDLRGAAEATTGRRQAVEPTPLGYNPNSGGTHARMPFWGVDRAAWEDTCTQAEAARCTTALVAQDSDFASLGEVALGQGVVRIVGTLFPDPLLTDDETADNRFGLADYALTYTAYQVFENLVAHQR